MGPSQKNTQPEILGPRWFEEVSGLRIEAWRVRFLDAQVGGSSIGRVGWDETNSQQQEVMVTKPHKDELGGGLKYFWNFHPKCLRKMKPF